MTKNPERMRKLARLLQQMKSLEELKLAELRQEIAEQLNTEVRLVEQLSNERLTDPRLLKSLARRLHMASATLQNRRFREGQQVEVLRAAQIKERYAEDQLALAEGHQDKASERAELMATLEDNLSKALVQRPAR